VSAGALGRWLDARFRSRIGIDYTLGPGHAPGAGRYVRELVRALVRVEDAPPLRLVEFGLGPRPMEGAPLGLVGDDVVADVQRRRVPIPRRALPFAAPVVGAAVGTGLKGFHRVDPAMPAPARRRTSLAVLEFPSDPEALSRLEDAIRAAPCVITFSMEAAERVAQVSGRPPHLAPVGCEHWARELGDSLQEHPRRATRDIVVLGAIRRSRRPLDVLRAFECLRGRGAAARLVMIGRPGDAAVEWRAALAASPVRDHVRWVAAPDETRMPGAVAGASALLHLADDEVSPVTPLEALRLGVPVVASPLAAFRDAIGDGARWAEATDPEAVAGALGGALEEALDGGPGLRARLAEPTRIYTWDNCAKAHLLAWTLRL